MEKLPSKTTSPSLTTLMKIISSNRRINIWASERLEGALLQMVGEGQTMRYEGESYVRILTNCYDI